MTAAQTLELLDWKRRVFSLYAAVRAMEPEAGWELWRDTRDELFRSHPQSPLPGYTGLAYYDYDPEARVLAELEDVESPPQAIETSGPDSMLFKPFARAQKTTLLDALKQTASEFAIAGDVADLSRMPVGTVCTVDGSGTLQFSASSELALFTNPLASVALPVKSEQIRVTAGGSLARGG